MLKNYSNRNTEKNKPKVNEKKTCIYLLFTSGTNGESYPIYDISTIYILFFDVIWQLTGSASEP